MKINRNLLTQYMNTYLDNQKDGDMREKRQELVKAADAQRSYYRACILSFLGVGIGICAGPLWDKSGPAITYAVLGFMGFCLMSAGLALYLLKCLDRSLKYINDPVDVSRFICRRRDFERCYGRKMLKRHDAHQMVNTILAELAETFIRLQKRHEDFSKASVRFDRHFSAAQSFVATKPHKAMLQAACKRIEEPYVRDSVDEALDRMR